MSNQSLLPVLLSKQFAAKQLSVTTKTLERRIADGTIRAVLFGRRVLIPREEIERISRG